MVPFLDELNILNVHFNDKIKHWNNQIYQNMQTT